jgi:hypothetical protein
VAQTEDLPASKQTVPGQVIAVYSR